MKQFDSVHLQPPWSKRRSEQKRMKLPKADAVEIAKEKITDYLLNPLHPDGAGKAIFFLAQGFRADAWHEFAEAVLEEAQIRCKNVPIATADARRPARRPRYSVLSAARLHDYGLRLSPWQSALKRFMEDYAAVDHRAESAQGR